MKPKTTFPTPFSPHTYPGDFISVTVETPEGMVEYTARIEHDADYHIDSDDCHNPDQSVTGCNDEQQADLLAAREAWFRDEWFYCTIVLESDLYGWEDFLPGIECNYPGPWADRNAHLTTVANELLEEAQGRLQRIAFETDLKASRRVSLCYQQAFTA